jgi:hypothetical protein
MPTVVGGEYQRITLATNVFRHMSLDGGDDMRRDRHVADTGVRLRGGGRVRALGADRGPPDADDLGTQINVAPA